MKRNTIEELKKIAEYGEDKREYELELTMLVRGEKDWASIECELTDILNNSSDDDVRYVAFYGLNILYRNIRNYDKLMRLIDKSYGGFYQKYKNRKSFDHLYALYELDYETWYNYDDIVGRTYNDALRFADNAGYVHTFADVFATICEKGGLEEKRKFLDDWADKALFMAEKAIELDGDYAKYYCTKARILSVKGDHGGAKQNIIKAIALEDSSRADYPLRLSKYQYYKLLIESNERFERLEKYTGFKIDENAIPNNIERVPIYDGDEPYVFVSYAHKDAEKVYGLIRLLQDKGLRVWCDCGIECKSEFAAYIEDRIEKARAFILMLSPAATCSQWVRRELSYAINKHDNLCNVGNGSFIPTGVQISPTELLNGMKLQLHPYNQIMQYTMSDEDFANKIVNDHKECVKRQ